MAVTATAYVPTESHATHGKAAVAAALVAFSMSAMNQLQKYPAAKPWTSPTPKSGLRKGGRRTGTLGRNWTVSAKSATSITVVNNTPYGSYVQGRKGIGAKAGGQTQVMAGRGWPNVTDVGQKALKDTIGAIGHFFDD